MLLPYSIEAVDHQLISPLGTEIVLALKKLRQYIKVTPTVLASVGLNAIVRKHTGLNINFVIEPECYEACVYVPQVNRDNPIIQQIRRQWMENVDATELMKNKDFIAGTVNLKTGKVSGDFCNLDVNIHIGELFLCKSSNYTVEEITAIILHEIGHVFVYLEMLARTTRTNYILMEGTIRLLATQNKEQRILLLAEIENEFGEKIINRDKYAEKLQRTESYQTTIIYLAVQQSKTQLNINCYDSRSFEQMADNFAIRLGYGRPLASGLDKLHRSGNDKAYLNPAINTVWMLIKFMMFILLLVGGNIMMAMAILAMGNPLSVTYDPIALRIDKIRQQYNDALKDKSLTASRKQKIIDDFKAVDLILDKMNDNPGVYEFIWRNLFPWGRTQQSLIVIQQQLEAMYNNDLYTAASILETNG